jgi:2-oxoisovalerate dehydrogenase E1 component
MHLFSPEVGLMGTTGIVGPNILQATGAGYSFMLMKSDRVSVCFFGDGAVNNGAFHEGINMAAIWNLPVVYVCENNMYATEVPFAYAARNNDVADRARTYGIPGIAADGNDVLAVTEAAGQAIDHARHGGGPTLIECRTYRTRPHAEGMRDGGYRSQEEIDAWKGRDPISALGARLIASGVATEQELAAIEFGVVDTVAAALKTATDSPYPDPDSASKFIYSS